MRLDRGQAGDLRGGEGFDEKTNNLLDGIRDISQRFNHRLAVKELPLCEAYIEGYRHVLVDLDWFAAGKKFHATVAFEVDVSRTAESATGITFTRSADKLPGVCDVQGGDEQVVLVDIVESASCPHKVISIVRLFVWPDGFEYKRDGLWEGARYRRIADGVFQIRPVLVRREGFSSFRIHGAASEDIPAIIQCRRQGVGGVTYDKGEPLAIDIGFDCGDILTSVKIVIDARGARALLSRLDSGIQIRDVVTGPLNFP